LKVVVLGSSGSAQSRNRACSSYLIDSRIVLDAGPGSFGNLLRYGANPLRITHVLITHMHGDHFFDLGSLVWGMSYLGRTDPLNVVGPPGIERALRGMLEFANTPRTFMRFDLKFTEIEPGESLELEGYGKVRTAPGKHSVADVAYRIGGLCYTGDTAPSDQIAKLCRGAELLIHEATGLSENEEYLNSVGHSSARQAAEIAVKSGTRRLLLTHIPPALSDKTGRLRSEARKVFRESYVARDLMEIDKV
jgi:ribonuclease Z